MATPGVGKCHRGQIQLSSLSCPGSYQPWLNPHEIASAPQVSQRVAVSNQRRPNQL